MAERPIIFSAPMVRALLAGSKTQTRRVVQWKGLALGINLGFSGLAVERFESGGGPRWKLSSRRGDGCWEDRSRAIACPYGQHGDQLWVRETFAKIDGQTRPWIETDYRATYTHGDRLGDHLGIKKRWTPAIHMPRAASRISLNVTAVRMERLHHISDADAKAEGAQLVDEVTGREVLFGETSRIGSYRLGFRAVWEQLNGAGSWSANPWVWVVSFVRTAA